MKKREISGTGNGISDDKKDYFITAMEDYASLISRVTKYLKGNKSKWFDHKYHTMTNWSGTYKIEVPESEFPFSLANTFSVTSWGRLQVAVVFPLKFRADSFHGGETDNMSVSLVTELYISDPKKFAKRIELPIELRRAALLELRDYYLSRREEKYKEQLASSEKSVAYLQAENVRREEESARATNIEIPELEKKIVQIREILSKEF